MAAPFYKVNNVNLLPYLADEGLAWEENDIDASDSGRTLDGKMHRGVVARKDKHSLTFRKLTLSEVRTVLAAVNGTYLTVSTNIHPKKLGTVTIEVYNSSRKGAVYSLEDDGTAYWSLDALSLIER